MEPINQRDIFITFIKFLALFFSAIVLVVWAFYFDAWIPKKELEKLNFEKKNFDTEKEYQKQIRLRLKEINMYLSKMEADSADKTNYNYEYLMGLKIAEVSTSIDQYEKEIFLRTDMNLSEKHTDSIRLGVYKEVTDLLQIVYNNQLENTALKRMVQPMQDYKKANEKYQEDYQTLQMELTKCQATVLELYKNNAPK